MEESSNKRLRSESSSSFSSLAVIGSPTLLAPTRASTPSSASFAVVTQTSWLLLLPACVLRCIILPFLDGCEPALFMTCRQLRSFVEQLMTNAVCFRWPSRSSWELQPFCELILPLTRRFSKRLAEIDLRAYSSGAAPAWLPSLVTDNRLTLRVLKHDFALNELLFEALAGCPLLEEFLFHESCELNEAKLVSFLQSSGANLRSFGTNQKFLDFSIVDALREHCT